MVLVVQPGITRDPHSAFPVLIRQDVVISVNGVYEGTAATVDSDQEGAS